MKNLILNLIIGIAFTTINAQQVVNCGWVTNANGQRFLWKCGQSDIFRKPDGSTYKCTCNCSNPSNPNDCVSVSGNSSSVNNNQSVEEYIFTELFKQLLTPRNNDAQTQAEKETLRLQKEEAERAKLEAERQSAIREAEMKRLVALKKQEEHDQMMKSLKTLEGEKKNIQMKGLDDMTSHENSSVVVRYEQDQMDSNTQTWVQYQIEQFKIRTEQPNYWCKKYYEDLERQNSALAEVLDSKGTSVPAKKYTEIEPGDVILIGDGNLLQTKIDAALNSNNSSFTHTVTCIKKVNEKKFYLDNTLGEGNRIIDEETFLARYGNREAAVAELRGVGDEWNVAQPLNETEAKALWDKAFELHQKNRGNVTYNIDPEDKKVKMNVFGDTNYGNIGKDDMVCSTSSWTLLKTTKRFQFPGVQNSKIIDATNIEVSPASFLNYTQYFLISPLEMK